MPWDGDSDWTGLAATNNIEPHFRIKDAAIVLKTAVTLESIII